MVAEPSAFLLTIDESSCCPTFSSAFDDIIVLDLTKIMASVSITSWEIDGETVETVSDFIFWGSRITADGDCSPMAYKQHPYQWPTIGVCPEHIERATLRDVMDFYHRFYVPNNAILSVVGNICFEEVLRLAEKWFGPIPRRDIAPRMLPQEKPQTCIRRKSVCRNVPANLLAMAFHMPCRKSHDYHTCDLITDLLSAGHSSRLIQHLIRRDRLFTSIDAYIQGSMDAGLLFVIGRVADGITLEEAEASVWKELDILKREEVPHEELSKVRNRSESERTFNNMNYLNRAITMAQMELIGQDHELHEELQRYCSVTADDIKRASKEIFRKGNCSVLYYKAEK